LTDVVVRGLVRESIDTSTGELRVQGLVREAIVAPGVGQNRLLVQSLVREVFVPAAAVARQYAVTVT